MADARFHNRSQPVLLGALAAAAECILADPAQAGFALSDVAPLDQAGPTDLSFLNNPKYRDQFIASKAGACIVTEEAAAIAPQGMRLLITRDPHRAYARAATLFYPFPTGDGSIAETAVIGSNLGKGCTVGHNAVIQKDVVIGDGCMIEAGAIIGSGVILGDHCWIGANASLSYCILGNNVRIHTGARIGQDGFGFAMGAGGHLPVPQLGRVIIGNNVNIGANTTVDRGAGPDTVIGDGCVIDNLVQIAHNVRMGRGCVIAAQAGIAGSCTLGDFVVLGGQVGIAGHLNIGSGARIAAQSGVTKDVPAGEEWVGFPAAPRRGYWKTQVQIKKLLGAKG